MGSEEEGGMGGVEEGGMAGEVEDGLGGGVEVASLPSAARPEGGGRKAPADAPGGQAVPRGPEAGGPREALADAPGGQVVLQGPEAGERLVPPPGSSRSSSCHAWQSFCVAAGPSASCTRSHNRRTCRLVLLSEKKIFK